MKAAVALANVAQLDADRSVTFRAFRLHAVRASELRIGEPASLESAVDAAKVLCLHKERLVIREDGGPEGARLHLFTIKRKSQPTWEWRGLEKVRVHSLYAEPVCVIPGEIFNG